MLLIHAALRCAGQDLAAFIALDKSQKYLKKGIWKYFFSCQGPPGEPGGPKGDKVGLLSTPLLWYFAISNKQ